MVRNTLFIGGLVTILSGTVFILRTDLTLLEGRKIEGVE